MRFGINLFPSVGPGDNAQYFEEALQLAELAEDLGFHHVKTVEHYLTPYGGYSLDPVTFLAAVAARTRRIRLVTGAVIPAFSHPIKLAGKLAMLDNISRGRLDVGFGRGFLPDEFTTFQIPMDESRARLDEGIEACRLLWSQENVRWMGRFHQFGPVTMLPRPYQRPHPRILVATATTPQCCEAAGRNGHGLMMVAAVSEPEKLKEMLNLYRTARADAGHPADDYRDVRLSYGCYLSNDADEAREKGRAYAQEADRRLAEVVSARAHPAGERYRGYDQIMSRVVAADFDTQLAENKTLVGTPEEVADRLAVIRGWYGDVTVSLQVTSGGMPYHESARTLRLFAGRVRPLLGERSG